MMKKNKPERFSSQSIAPTGLLLMTILSAAALIFVSIRYFRFLQQILLISLAFKSLPTEALSDPKLAAESAQEAAGLLELENLGLNSLNLLMQKVFLNPYSLWVLFFAFLVVVFLFSLFLSERKRQAAIHQDLMDSLLHHQKPKYIENRDIVDTVQEQKKEEILKREQIHTDYQKQQEWKENIFHQTKSCLNASLMSLDIISMDPDQKDQQLENLENQLNQSLKLCDLYLKNSTAKTGEPIFHFHLCDLQSILTEALQNLKLIMPAANIESKIDHHFMIHADTIWLQEAILSLLSNALHYSPSNMALVKMEVDQNQAIITISNPIENTFKPDEIQFGRYEGLRKPGHYGIGLHMVQNIIQAHKGQIEIIPDSSQVIIKIILPAFIG